MTILETRAATIAPATLNREAGTVDVVLSTGAPVKRAGYVERLAIDPAAVTIAPRLPVLDSHRQASIQDVKGRVENVRFEAGQLVATLRISDPAALAAIERGDVTGVSIGYRVAKWQDSSDATGQRVRTATTWELVECSLVAIPADPQALIRSATLPELSPTAPDAATLETRAAIRAIAATAGLDSAWSDSQIDSGADVTAARSAAFDAMAQRSAQPIRTATVGASGDDPAVIQARQVEALSARMMGTAPTDAARPFMQMGLTDYARDALTRSGTVGVAMMGREEILQRAMHTVSDFPELLTGAGNRVLADAYRRAESPLKQLARQRTAADFRPLSTLKIGNFTKLEKVTEAGEIKALSTAEAKEGYSLETFGGIFSLSRKAIINDDLGAFARWGEMMGQAAAETESGQLLALLSANARAGVTMGDGKALFHVDHGNLAGTGAALSEATLDAARQAMRTQKMMDGTTPVNVVPRFLVVSPARETAAEKLLTSIQANTTADVNPFGGKLSLIVEPRLTGNGWFIFGDPATAPVLEYAYLSSAQGPQLSSRDGWEVLGREFRVTLDFGAGATDHRGAYRNAGA
ncbi:Caudovirus prohead protease [Aquimixticola soesokkakensis]|uniref:Caudovirus prohead protease n=2 Tax=Paracoccaceae TaxID=31989 RepID=A0A1Y5SA13_9RHOB|nr:prohead protease/major capsid protein fusion protein [Aquimixticola soesokkakensis]SLN35637.1 Caudovirus prohead protease [Aquimixticola soesokkakensis]